MRGKTKKRLWIGLVVFALLLVGARLALPGFVRDYVNKKLDEHPEYDGKVGDVDIHILRGAYSIHGVKIVKTATNAPPEPFFEAKLVDFSVEWRELLTKSLVGEVWVENASLNFVKSKDKEQSQTTVDASWLGIVKDLFPFRINRFEIADSSITFQDIHAKPKVDLQITNLFAVATNLTNARDLVEKLPGSIRARGKTIGGGSIALNMRLNPLEADPAFDLNLSLTNVDLTALNPMLEAYGKVDVKRGTFEVFSEIYAEDGKFEGYVKPFFRDLDVFEFKTDNENPLKMAWQAIVAGAMKLFKNHDKDQVATKIPIRGEIGAAKAEIWTTVANVLKNAFVQAFSPTIDKEIGPQVGLSKETREATGKGKGADAEHGKKSDEKPKTKNGLPSDRKLIGKDSKSDSEQAREK
jgi:hypothetical protein